jgi:general stress protein YciG
MLRGIKQLRGSRRIGPSRPLAYALIPFALAEPCVMSAGPKNDEDEIDRDDDEAPETPTDEPTPVPIEDPPAEPNEPPMVVGGRTGSAPTAQRGGNMSLNAGTGERKERRGFASMSPEKQREIASKGGRAAHAKGTAHEWTSEEARSAGRKGGQISRGGRGRLATAPDDSPIVTDSAMPAVAADINEL